MTIATLIEDKNCRGTFRVEAIIEDGAVEVAIFSGPNVLERAIFFAGAPRRDITTNGTILKAGASVTRFPAKETRSEIRFMGRPDLRDEAAGEGHQKHCPHCRAQ